VGRPTDGVDERLVVREDDQLEVALRASEWREKSREKKESADGGTAKEQ